METADSDNENSLFVLVHGRYHSGKAWELVQEELKRQGYDSIAPTLDISDTKKNLDDHAQQVVEQAAVKRPENVIMNGWSWGANIILRCTVGLPIRQLQFTAPSLQSVSFARSERLEMPGVGNPPEENSRYTILYEAWKHLEEQNIEEEVLARQMGVYMFYHDVDAKITSEILNDFRSHPRHPDGEPMLNNFPDNIPKVIYIPGQDKVLRADWLEWQAQLLNAKIKRYRNSGHALLLSQPRALAKQMIRDARVAAGN